MLLMRSIPGLAVLLVLAALNGCRLPDGALDPLLPPEPRSPQNAALLHAVLRAADARVSSDAALAPVRQGLASSSAEIRRHAVNAMGRLEEPRLVEWIAPLLGDSVPAVRAEAANALGQAVHGDDASPVRPLLLSRVGVESDPFVRGVLAQTLGRLRHTEAGSLAGTASAIEALSRMNGANAPSATLLGVVKAYHHFVRQPFVRASVPPGVPVRLRELLAFTSDGDSLARLESERIRTVAAAALGLTGAATATDLDLMQRDASPMVRREALLAALATGDTALVLGVTTRLLQDPAAAVRLEAVRTWLRGGLAAADCAPLLAATADPATAVRLQAIDALPDCVAAPEIVRRVIVLVDSLPAAVDVGWHVSAHAVFALARLAPDSARASLGGFIAHGSPFVRAWAARSAAPARDAAALYRLAADSAAIVRTAALVGLAELVGRAADTVALAALRADDGELVMTAARALEGTRDTAALPALFDALERITAMQRETSRDPRLALLDRIEELGGPADTVRLSGYLTDFDLAVARRAAALLVARTGRPADISPRPLTPAPVPSPERLDSLALLNVIIEMESGDTVELLLRPWTAPTNVDRFVRLAGSGWFEGLTFHRVAPNFVVQGGSPGANEYAGDGPFTRDELGIHGNWRGSIGLSTRGRDTGDGQIYINLVDNIRLDHDYTVFGQVVSDMAVVDRMLEGARIRRTVLR
jgi:cyclophilin family peptidyl-prolyl cis-trans isomerase